MATTREVAPPAKLWVTSYEFPFEFLHPEDPILEGDDGCMESDEDKRGIYVSASLDARKMLEIVWHEVTHAINWACDIDEEKDVIDEETIALQHGLSWSQFFLDNPKFVRWYVSVVNRIRKERKHA